ncbi:Tol-Pal system-associated acyl-CoA thioesterase [hydrothermal vent metagenome]|uniref:Tol-Pal system-associated acyl-CoA thioesterase n=1 Tax=hydrothermal vent metagenome TaxID=652676 RepID=A0A3B1BZL5_9ZZZZ
MSKTVIEVYYEDTDCGGVVYYANYLRFFERARTKHFKERGVDPAEWMEKGVVFTVTRAEVEYKAPSKYGDTLVVDTDVESRGGARLTFTYKITKENDGALIVTGKTEMACVNDRMRPQRIPDQIMEKIT